jgi:hypothetical protein
VVYTATDRPAAISRAYTPRTNLANFAQDYYLDQKFSQVRLMRKIVVALAVVLVLMLLWRMGSRASAPTPVCPRGYYLVPGPNSYAGNPRVCMPRGEFNSEDAIPAVNYMPPLDATVIQSL